MTGEEIAATAAETPRARRKAARKPYTPAPVVVPVDWRERETITVPEYAAIVRVGRNTAYFACARGDVATIRVGGRVLVCVPALLHQLEGK